MKRRERRYKMVYITGVEAFDSYRMFDFSLPLARSPMGKTHRENLSPSYIFTLILKVRYLHIHNHSSRALIRVFGIFAPKNIPFLQDPKMQQMHVIPRSSHGGLHRVLLLFCLEVEDEAVGSMVKARLIWGLRLSFSHSTRRTEKFPILSFISKTSIQPRPLQQSTDI